jgi:hypothetical protein
MNMDVAPKPEKKMFFKTDLTNVVIIVSLKKVALHHIISPRLARKYIGVTVAIPTSQDKAL